MEDNDDALEVDLAALEKHDEWDTLLARLAIEDGAREAKEDPPVMNWTSF